MAKSEGEHALFDKADVVEVGVMFATHDKEETEIVRDALAAYAEALDNKSGSSAYGRMAHNARKLRSRAAFAIGREE